MGKLTLFSSLGAKSFLLMLALPLADTTFADNESPAELDAIVSVAAKSPRPVSDVAGSVAVITEEQIDRDLAQDITDLVRYQPGISVEANGTRFGASGFQVRGIGGNRVTVEIDGVPVSDQFDIGNFSNAGRDFIEPELIKRVEILRGPASTLYGSDAIGGVISILTKDPHDLLLDSDNRYSINGKVGYNSDDQSNVFNAHGAIIGGQVSGMLSATRRNGHEVDNKAAGTPDDPQDFDRTNVLGKLVYDFVDGGRLRAIADIHEENVQTDIRSFLGEGRFATTTSLTGDDEQRRQRYAIDYEWLGASAFLRRGIVRGFHQDSEIEQFTIQERGLQSPPVRQERLFTFDQQTRGIEANLQGEFTSGAVQHVFGYGVELLETETVEQRNATEINLVTGAQTNILLGENFPLRDFPITETVEAGIYFQDEIKFSNKRFTLIPALRYDYYDLDPKPDAVFNADNPNTGTTGLTENSISPRLGAIYRVTDGIDVFAQYVRGFRTPPFEDVNIGLDIPIFNIRAIPNPDLKAETSDGLEAGVRFDRGATQFEVAGFYNEYDDFIETKINLGPDPASGVI
ncbi:MAG: TonB-dependent receptor, partial [Gammaproteobacteria bacterium]|nr:TonB-dependent receptor [Gammaproteobacteria bacterium]